VATTFLDLTNKVLRRLNEVEITSSDFSSVTGVQALAKDSVRDAIAKISQAEFEWPFNSAEHTQVMAVGQEEYTWPTFFKVAEWNSFQIVKDDSISVSATSLNFIERDLWYRNYRDLDDNAGTTGTSIPEFVFPSHGNGYGVSPSPDKAYTVKFRYYLTHTGLDLFSDTSRVPTNHDAVIIDGALFYMYLFKDNMEAAQISAGSFQQGIKEMQSIHINKYESVRDRRVKF
tara:strand:+ start:154 stop:843 length:690 start_codon:yes stop_codon:yes gene_type:complete